MDPAGISSSRSILVMGSAPDDPALVKRFCGRVVSVELLDSPEFDCAGATVYLCGDLSRIEPHRARLAAADRVFRIVDKYEGEGDQTHAWPAVSLGRVPVDVHGLGVYFPAFFDPGEDYFARVCAEHEFQSLTESTKPARAHRTGFYATPVVREGQDLHFHLLRCSTNFAGPTENFRANDIHVVDALNRELSYVVPGAARLNHVLAQIYHDTPTRGAVRQKKAKIKAHADKTKDMPEHGVIAFCTFYDGRGDLTPLAGDAFDFGYKGRTGLTRLHFRIKDAAAVANPELPPEFDVVLYPNSVLVIPLTTNRSYTHETRSPNLPAERVPTRMGYVIRCSNTPARHRDQVTYLKRGDQWCELEAPSSEGVASLRRLYAEENRSDGTIDYGDDFCFSMNEGDYRAPNYNPRDEFREYDLGLDSQLFEPLRDSVDFQEVNHGRLGGTLVRPNAAGDTPLVRTTTTYEKPAQCFSALHRRLAELIRDRASLGCGFDNALIECYSNAYRTMGYHSDQALDLEASSCIAILSCYEHPGVPSGQRKLIVASKTHPEERFEIPLRHGHVVVFSVATNRRFRHKIVLDRAGSGPDNRWLGITFRSSCSYLRQFETGPRWLDGTPLTLATEDEGRKFYAMRRRENESVDFVYPRLSHTLSPSDLMPPAPAKV